MDFEALADKQIQLMNECVRYVRPDKIDEMVKYNFVQFLKKVSEEAYKKGFNDGQLKSGEELGDVLGIIDASLEKNENGEYYLVVPPKQFYKTESLKSES